MLLFAPREALGGGCCDTVRDELAAVRWPPEAVRAYCDHLEAAGRAPATIALHLAALRRVAVELGAEARIANLKPSASRAASRARRRSSSSSGCRPRPTCAPTVEAGSGREVA
jgi:hypothetical protein